MRVEPNFDIEKWCVYNESKFKLELKEDAPEDIKEKFKKWEEAYDEPFERAIIEEKNKMKKES